MSLLYKTITLILCMWGNQEVKCVVQGRGAGKSRMQAWHPEAMGSPRHFCGCADPLQPVLGPVAICVFSSGSLEGPQESVLSQVTPACLGRPWDALRQH